MALGDLEQLVMLALLRRIATAEGAAITDEALALITRAAEGSARDATSLLDQAISHGAGETTAGQVREQSTGVAVHFANAYTVALADDDAAYGALFSAPGSVTFTDGMPVAWIGRRQHPEAAAVWDRVYGPDVMAGVPVAGPRRCGQSADRPPSVSVQAGSRKAERIESMSGSRR